MPRLATNGFRLALAALLLAASAATAQVRTVLQEPGTTVPVVALAVSPDGQTAAWGGNGTVRIGDARTGKARAEWKTQSLHLTFTRDGKRLVGWGSGLAVWDVGVGKEALKTFTPVTDAVPTADPKAAVLTNPTGRVWVADLTTGAERAVLQTGTQAVGGVTYSPDGKWVAAGDAAGRVRTWDRASGRPGREFGTGGSVVSQLEFTSDNETLTATRIDGTVHIWNVADGTLRAEAKGQPRDEWSVAFTPDGNVLAFHTPTGSVEVWDLRAARRRIAINPAQALRFGSMGLTPDGNAMILSAPSRNETGVFDATTGKELTRVPRGTGGTDVADGGKAVLISTEPTGVRLYDAATGKDRGALEGFNGRSLAASSSIDAKWVAAGNNDEACVWDSTTRQLRCRMSAFGRCGYMMFSPDAKVLAGKGSGGPSVTLWNGETGAKLAELPDRANGVWAYKFSPDSKELLVGTLAGGLRSFDTAGRVVRTYQSAAGMGRLAVSPDGSRVAFAPAEGEVSVWDAKAWGEPSRLRTATAAGLAFAPVGPDLAVVGRDGSVVVWDAAERKPKRPLAPPGGPPLFADSSFAPVAYSPDGRTVAAGTGDGKVRVWEAETGKPVATGSGHTGAVRVVAFAGPGALVSIGLDDTVRVWDAATGAERENLRQQFTLPRAAVGAGGALAGSSTGTLVRIDAAANTARTLAQPTVRADRFLLAPDGSLAVLVEDDRVVLWPLAGDRPPVRYESRGAVRYDSRTVVAALAPDGSSIAVGTSAGQLELWDPKTLAPAATLVRPVSPMAQTAVAPDASAVAVVTQDGFVSVWDAASGKTRWAAPPKANRIGAQSAAFGDRGRLLAVTTFANELRVFDAATGEEKYAAAGKTAAALDPARPLAASVSAAGLVTFWAGEGKAPPDIPRDNLFRPATFAFCAGGKSLLIQAGAAAELWEVETGKQLASRAATRAAVSPDGGHVVFQGERESVVFDAAAGRPVGRPLARAGTGTLAEVGNGGRFAADRRPDGLVLWDTETGKPVPGIPTNLHGAAVAPDGTALAFTDSNGITVIEYDTDTPKFRFTNPAGGYGTLHFTPDGRFLYDRLTTPAKAWDAATGKAVPTSGSDGARFVGGAAADRVLVQDRDGALRLAALGGGESPVVHPGPSRPVAGLAFTPDGRGLLVADGGGWSQYDLAERRRTRFTPGYPGTSPELIAAADGSVLATSHGLIRRIPAAGTDVEVVAQKSLSLPPAVSADGRWALMADGQAWFVVDVAEKKLTETAKLPPGARVSIAPNGRYAAAWQEGGGPCRVLSFPGLDERCGLDSPHRTTAVAWSPDSSRLAAFNTDGVVRLWAVPSGRFEAAVAVPGGANAGRAGLRFSADGKRLVAGTETGALSVLDVDPGPERAVCRGHTSAVLAVAVSPDGSTVYSAAADKTVRAWASRTGQLRATSATREGFALGLAVSPDGRRLASAGADGSVRLWDADGRLRELRSWSVPGPVWCVAFSTDGTALVAGCDDGTVRVIPLPKPPWPFDERSWPEATEVESLAGNAGAVFSLAFSPDGKTLYGGTGTFDDLAKPGRVLRWDFATRKRGEDLGESKGAVLALAATVDRVASGGGDRAVTLWGPSGVGKPVVLSGHAVAVRGLAFLPGGRLLSAGGAANDPRATGEVKVWDLASGREVPPLLGQRSGVAAVAASADGLLVATAGWDEVVRVWNFGKPDDGLWWPWPR